MENDDASNPSNDKTGSVDGGVETATGSTNEVTGAVEQGGLGGLGGGLLPPQISRWGGSAPPLSYHQVMNNFNLIAISVLSCSDSLFK